MFSQKLLHSGLFIVLALIAGLAIGCGDDDDDDNDDGTPPVNDDVDDDADDDVDDDVDDDTDDDVDDDTGPELVGLFLDQNTRAIPQTVTKTFIATAEWSDGSFSTDANYTWESDDSNVLTVDQSGNATGVADGVATISVSLQDMTDHTDVIVGADVFYFDAVGDFLCSYDRITGTVTNDYLAARDVVFEVPSAMALWDGVAYVADSGEHAVPGEEDGGLVIIDLFAKTSSTLAYAGFDNPWMIKIAQDAAYVSGQLSNNLAVVNLWTDEAVLYDLTADCTPVDLEVVGDKVYVACSRYNPLDWTYGDPGQLAILDLSENPATLTTVDLPRINPQHMAITPDGSSLYVVSTGDYYSAFGLVSEIDLASDTVVDSFDLGNSPGVIAITDSGKAFIGDADLLWADGQVYVVDTSDNTILRGDADPIIFTGAGGIMDIAVSPFSGALYLTNWGTTQTSIMSPDDYSLSATPDTNFAQGYSFWQ